MKNITLILLLLLSFGCGQVQQKTSSKAKINVMTFNIRYDNPEDGENNWKYRKDRVANTVYFYDVDILGTQEVLYNQLEDLKKALLEYDVVGVGREDGKKKGEYSALWYRKERFSLLDSGNFWLSETPETVGSKGWDAACERIASWAKLKDISSGQDYFVLNTHLDHVGVVARREGIRLILDRIQELSNGLPVIVTGDFNSEPDSEVVKQITDTNNSKSLIDTRSIAPIIYGPSWSFHDFGEIPYEKRPLIDYIFIRNGLSVLRYGVLAGVEDGVFVSDHTPVFVTLK